MNTQLRVAIVGPDALFRDGIAALLIARSITAVADTFPRVEEMLSAPCPGAIDAVLIDCTLPGIATLSATFTRLQLSLPDIAIVALAHQRDMTLLAPLIRGRRRAIVMKEEGYVELVKAMSAVLTGAKYPTPGTIPDPQVEDATRDVESRKRLSTRELEIMQLIACGQRTREIAERLSLSPKTVEKHRYNLMRKIGARNMAGVALFAVQHQPEAMAVSLV